MVIVIRMSTTRRVVQMEIVVRKKDSNEKGPEPGTGGVEIVRTMEVKTPERRSSGYSHFFGSKFVRITHSLQSRFFNFGTGDNLIDLELYLIHIGCCRRTTTDKDVVATDSHIKIAI